MSEQERINFERIAKAISYIEQNFKTQPNLDEVAEKVNLSPFHFQRLFKEWAGVTPKKFLQYISVNHAKSILAANNQSLFDTAEDVGLSGTGRLHDLFVNIEGMTPGEFKNGGENLTINYSYANSKFGQILTAATLKGLCYMGFSDENGSAFEELKARFPKATFKESMDGFQRNGAAVFGEDWSKINKVKLHLKGTAFQLKVWEALLKIPTGKLSTYGDIAHQIDKPKAARAVGTAIGGNPIAFLIPCHRVIQSSGIFGGYMWGPNRKTAIIGWEAAQREHQN
ncbi:bifunctional helix-turn-helix domain-containing protein/methylated-DNA--[protein]-cysteine S-methyltransferase [Arcticibacterium luteifluviistationis]|uniref:methylated-DNA--[protein]-cysteine S-methyltransferase n=1 Tax=Arcticibacterium luteifluviistationis TaxID=1784714 RepID=A0A2Z4GA74_9BACT|nr:methylated-DNA--[protein]-cysteine S-methyltransferase [Arcticibacterium luteifluviistationis]AWV97975.1 cysteine methyltransferase [Arcticibacterium luteifluviistationis]